MAKVLVVDDDEGVRSSVCGLLQSAGYETEEAEDGEKALRLVASDVDLVVLDLHMPTLDGTGLLKALSDDGPIVIVLSAFEYWTRHDMEADYANRVCAFLRKPVPPTTLLDVVRNCLWRDSTGER